MSVLLSTLKHQYSTFIMALSSHSQQSQSEHVRACACVRVCARARTYVCLCVCMHMLVHVCVRVRVCKGRRGLLKVALKQTWGFQHPVNLTGDIKVKH